MTETYGELTITPANSFGYVVRASMPNGYLSQICCAGSLDDCLEFIRKAISKNDAKTDGESA